MRTLLLFATLISFMAQAQVEVSSVLELEERLESKINKTINRYDPWATARVKVRLHRYDSILPGTNLRVEQDPLVDRWGTIRLKNIREITVKIQSSQAELPEWLLAEIKNNLEFSGVKVSTKFHQYDEETLKGIQTAKYQISDAGIIARELNDSFFMQLKQISHQMLFGFVACLTTLFFLSTIFVGFLIWRRNKREDMTAGVKSAPFGHASGYSPTSNLIVEKQIPFESFSKLSLESIFCDAYWCQEDEYAAFVWAQLSVNQKSELLINASLPRQYFNWISTLNPVSKTYHLDPHYLEPLPYNHISQSDLLKWISNSHHASWMLLSNMRKANLTLSVQDRMKCLNAKAESAGFESLPSQKSVFRTLAQGESMFTVSAEEEYAIWKNPGQYPKHFREQCLSLAWFAFLTRHQTERVLMEFSAQELSTAWVAHPEVLNYLRSCMPERKAQMVESYTHEHKADKHGIIFRQLLLKVNAMLVQEDVAYLKPVQKAA